MMKRLLALGCNAFMPLRFVNLEDEDDGLGLGDDKHPQGPGLCIGLLQHLISSDRHLQSIFSIQR